MTFESLVMAQLLHAITSRSDSHSIFDRSPRQPNHALSLILGGSMALQAACLFIPFVRRLLGLAPVTGTDTIITIAGGTLPFLAMEWMKSRRDTVEGELVWTREKEWKNLPARV